MAPLIQDIDLSYSDNQDDLVLYSDNNYKSLPTPPLHEEKEEKRVWFASMTVEYEVMNRYEYTTEERKNSWFDPSEMKTIRDAAKSEAKLVEKGLLQETADFSVRGLEQKTRRGVLRKRKRRTNAYLAVFFEIDTQNEEGFSDDDLVADAYYLYTEPCAIEAEKIARQDAAEARTIYLESNSNWFQTMLGQTMQRD